VTETERLVAVRRYKILDTPPDGAFDRITAIATRLLKVPIALISIVDDDRIWFKSRQGIEADQVARDLGLCA
jgi:eukaryotic-like serine/threonine-protein kinase